MGLWERLFGSRAQQSAAPTASYAENIPAIHNAPAPVVNRRFESPFKIGDRIGGRYEVHRILGGGMGTVYVAYDDRSRVVLALKTFQNRAEDSAEQRALEATFEKEASAWIALERHAYIVRALWVQKVNDRLFIAMEYIAPDERQRNTLRHYLVGKPLTLDQTLHWGIEFCYGMEHALRKGVLCHRDVKPDNLLISSNGHVKITDFGLAAALDDREALEPNGAGAPGYNPRVGRGAPSRW